MRLATSSGNAACQERRSITGCFAARSRAHACFHSRLQTRIAGAPHQIDKRSHTADNGTTPRYSGFLRLFFGETKLLPVHFLSTAFPD